MGLNITAKLGIAGTIGAVICAIGAVMFVIFPDIVNNKIKESFRLVNGTLTYESWERAPIPIYMQIYLFNVTNADAILTNKSKPILQQLGPYTFRQYRQKVNVTFNENDTVSYRQIRQFIFEPHNSSGLLNDTATVINLPLVSLGQKTEGELTTVELFVLNNLIRLYKAKVFVKKTVDQLLYTGYRDELLVDLGKKKKEDILPNGTFGFFYGQNDTDDGLYTVFSGVGDSSKFLQISEWNGIHELPFWGTTYCNTINGTDGSMFQSFLTKESTIRLFSTDLCRSIHLRYEEEKYVHGIKTFRFAPPFDLLAAPDIIPDNRCFCEGEETCLGSGLLNISVCKKGAPVVVSPPHFYQSDFNYLNAVIGLHPSKFEHGTILDIEPTTGVVMRAMRRLQINAALRPVTHIHMMKNLPRMIMPIFWVNESAHIDVDRAEKFKDKVFKPQKIGSAVTIALMAVGGFIVLCVVLYGLKVFNDKNEKQRINVSSGGHQANLPHVKYEEVTQLKPLVSNNKFQ